jgi:hypothetical protein
MKKHKVIDEMIIEKVKLVLLCLHLEEEEEGEEQKDPIPISFFGVKREEDGKEEIQGDGQACWKEGKEEVKTNPMCMLGLRFFSFLLLLLSLPLKKKLSSENV